MGIESVEIAVEGSAGDAIVFEALVAGPAGGEPVVLLHGFPETAHEWVHVMGPLAERGYRVVAPHTRGRTPRCRPAEVADYHVRHLAADTLAIAEWVADGPVHLVGHDWGSLIAWYVAAHHPDRLQTLTSVSVPHPRPFADARRDDEEQREKSSYIATFRTPGAGEDMLLGDDATVLRLAFSQLEPADARAHLAMMTDRETMTSGLNYYRAWDDALDELGPVRVPTLFVWGSADEALGRTAAEDTAEWVQAPYRFEVMEGVSHWIPEVAPERLTELLLEHLAR